MKTAISLPDELFIAAEKTAKLMGLARSQLFAKALEEFIKHHNKDDITERLNRVYEKSENLIFSDINSACLESIRELTKNDSW